MIRYLALGDSYTIGEGVHPSDRWPAQLAASLQRSGVDCAAPEYVARTGWTTDELSSALAIALGQGAITPPFDLVSLQIGVNNHYRGRPLPEFRKQFSGLLKQAIHLAGELTNRVLVISIPDWGVTPFAEKLFREQGYKVVPAEHARVTFEIDAYNAAKQTEALQYGVHFIDITPLTRVISADPDDWLVDDQLHPSPPMYAAWVERILPVAQSVLRRTD